MINPFSSIEAPTEILFDILKYLSPEDLKTVRIVCRPLQALSIAFEHSITRKIAAKLARAISSSPIYRGTIPFFYVGSAKGYHYVYCSKNMVVYTAYNMVWSSDQEKANNDFYMNSQILFQDECSIIFRSENRLCKIDKRTRAITFHPLKSNAAVDIIQLLKKASPESQNNFIQSGLSDDLIYTSFPSADSFYTITSQGLVTFKNFSETKYFSIPITYALGKYDAVIAHDILLVREKNKRGRSVFFAYNLKTREGKQIQGMKSACRFVVKHGQIFGYTYVNPSEIKLSTIDLIEHEDYYSAMSRDIIPSLSCLWDKINDPISNLRVNKHWTIYMTHAKNVTTLSIFNDGALFDKFDIKKDSKIQLYSDFLLIYNTSGRMRIRDIQSKKDIFYEDATLKDIAYAELETKALNYTVVKNCQLALYSLPIN